MENEELRIDQVEEQEYFDSVMHHIDTQLAHEVEAYDNAEQELQKYLYSSWEDGTHMGASIDRLIEAVQIGRFARTQELLADKRMAEKKQWRIPESTLLTAAAFGGSIGVWSAMYVVRHKTKHTKFVIGVPVILAAQIGFVLYLLFR